MLQKVRIGDPIHILTLSNSSTICSAILFALQNLKEMTLLIHVLESRPRCEGADMAAAIHHSACNRDRIFVHVVPDSAVGSVTKLLDIVLLGADRISPTGNVSNKIGSLAAVLCAKWHSRKVKVITLSDRDKIAATNLPDAGEEADIERHPSSELSSAWSATARIRLENRNNVEIYGEWFEWVSACFIDDYVTETGVMTVEHIEATAQQTKELDRLIFQHQHG